MDDSVRYDLVTYVKNTNNNPAISIPVICNSSIKTLAGGAAHSPADSHRGRATERARRRVGVGDREQHGDGAKDAERAAHRGAKRRRQGQEGDRRTQKEERRAGRRFGGQGV